MDYRVLAEANSTINKVDIKGKDYAAVNERVKVFRMLYPEGRVNTEIVKLENGFCMIKATIKDEFGNELATGHAYEMEGNSFINKTSYIENCETSAVGRALGFLGIGIDCDIASYEEAENAMMQQTELKKIPAVSVKALRSRLENNNVDEQYVCALYKIDSLEDMNNRMHKNINVHFDELLAKYKAEK